MNWARDLGLGMDMRCDAMFTLKLLSLPESGLLLPETLRSLVLLSGPELEGMM